MSIAAVSRVSLKRHPPFILFLLTRGFSRMASQIAAVAVGWQVYSLTGSAFALGMVGLVQFVPSAALVFLAGHVADRFVRRRIVQLCMLVSMAGSVYLAWGAAAGWLTVPEIFCVLVVLGAATAFEYPAVAAMLPAVVPPGAVQQGTAVSTGVNQLATIVGPALGGFAYAIDPAVPYALMTVFSLTAAVLGGLIIYAAEPHQQQPMTLRSVFAGIGFVWNNPSILGTISLDLFAVLLGGATALLPIYASDILHTGPLGLGVMRAAPAVGALLMTVVLARSPIRRRVGMRMFQAVIVFGVGTVAFALSTSIWLTCLALIVMGAADTVSVVIRFSLVQLSTPDAMRGRVGAVNYLFINASNQLGQFESGVTAALFGAMPAAVLGGVGTVAVALLWMKLFPSLRHVERLE